MDQVQVSGPSAENQNDIVFQETGTTQETGINAQMLQAIKNAEVAEDYYDTVVPQADKKYLNMTDGNVWNRSNGDWKKSADGKTEIYSFDKEGKRLSADNCFSAGVENRDAGLCAEHMEDAILSQDSAKMNAWLEKAKANNFYQTSVAEIKNMHPEVALKVLKRFGFRTQSQSGRVVVDDVDHWYKHYLTKEFQEPTLSAISSNGKLLAYLDLVSQFVNHNSSILNGGIGSGPIASGNCGSNSFTKGLNIEPRHPISGPQSVYGVGQLRSHQRNNLLSATSRTGASPFWPSFSGSSINSPLGSNILGLQTSSMVMPFRQAGGGTGYKIKNFQMGGAADPTGAVIIQQVFSDVIGKMNSRGKKLNEKDNKNLNDRIAKLVAEERGIVQDIHDISAYNEYLRSNNTGTGTVSMDTLRALVQRHSRHQKRYMSHEAYLIEILEKVIRECDGGDGGNWQKL